jgi:drug/metabolite transporter (DMT)-like permease
LTEEAADGWLIYHSDTGQTCGLNLKMTRRSIEITTGIIPIAAAIGASICWGGATVMSKAALHYAPPLTLFLIQMVSSFCFLLVLLRGYPHKFRWSYKLVRVGATGLLEPGIAYLLGNLGLKFTTASNASAIISSEPLIIILIAWIILRERVRPSVLCAACVAIAGVLLVAGRDILNVSSNSLSIAGDILIATGTVCAAVYVVLSHKIVQDFDPLHLLVVQQGYAIVLVLIAERLGHFSGSSWFTDAQFNLAGMATAGWIWAVLSGIFQYACAFWLYLIALKRLPANIAAVFLALIPAFGTAGAWLFLDEVVGWNTLMGIAIIIGATIVASRKPAADPAHAEEVATTSVPGG